MGPLLTPRVLFKLSPISCMSRFCQDCKGVGKSSAFNRMEETHKLQGLERGGIQWGGRCRPCSLHEGEKAATTSNTGSSRDTGGVEEDTKAPQVPHFKGYANTHPNKGQHIGLGDQIHSQFTRHKAVFSPSHCYPLHKSFVEKIYFLFKKILTD